MKLNLHLSITLKRVDSSATFLNKKYPFFKIVFGKAKLEVPVGTDFIKCVVNSATTNLI